MPEWRQTYQILAIAAALHSADAARQSAAVNALLGDLKARGANHNVGLIGWTQLLPVLTALGHDAAAQRLALSTTWPSIGYMVAHGATTLWERWTPPDPDARVASTFNNTSLNHPIGAWLVSGLAGLDVRRLGLTRRISIRPGVDWAAHGGAVVTGAEVELATLLGRAVVSWRVAASGGAAMELNCTVPIRAVASVQIGFPRGTAAAGTLVVEEGGEVVWVNGALVPGVVSAEVGAEGVSVVLMVGAGEYEWIATE